MQPLGRGGAVQIFSKTITELINQLITEVFVEQPLAPPGSAKNIENFDNEIVLTFVNTAAYSILVQGALAGDGSHGGDDRHLDRHLDSWTTAGQVSLS